MYVKWVRSRVKGMFCQQLLQPTHTLKREINLLRRSNYFMFQEPSEPRIILTRPVITLLEENIPQKTLNRTRQCAKNYQKKTCIKTSLRPS